MPRKRKPKVNRRAKGTGSLFFDSRRQQWVCRVPVGRKPNGTVQYREIRADTQEAVIERAKAVQPPLPGITLADWSVRWMASLDVREQSKRNYNDHLKLRIIPTLGSRPVAQLTAFDIEEAWKRWGTGPGGVGARTIRLTLAALSACLRAAIRAKIVSENVVAASRKPKPDKFKHDLFSPEELRTVLAACLENRKLHALAVCCATGCRIGEALALSPDDYDATASRLSISRTVVNRTRGVGPPKSKNGVRVIDVPKVIAPALAHRPDTTRYRAHLRRWTALLGRLGVRYRPIHALRHSVISHAIAAGVPIANVARDAGDSVQTVVATYCQAVPGKSICDAMETLLGGTHGGASVAPEGPKRGKTRKK